ncbi:MAG: DMT family transporter [Prevotellaceae bacterium]|jgi:drug/metabolite transporter (DMT)-like permease|nr:DMT family transporter [Prevotellaceae bacterium]
MKIKGYYHIFVLFSVGVWGATFVSTKVLLNNGLNPSEIFVLRFSLAYLLISVIAPKKLLADSKKDELLFICAGLTGGSLYFLAENTALRITLASNVSLIICTTPLITALCSHYLVKGERLRKKFVYGSLIALTGVAFVVFNGHFILKINPLGDLLTIAAALMWALYNVVLKRLDKRYSTVFVTRKVFAYGLLTILPVFIFEPFDIAADVFLRPAVIVNILFLGVIASMLCFIIWNIAVKNIGVVRSSNYLYLTPIVTLITSYAVINEPVTPIAMLGAGLIIGGVCLAK